MNAADLHATLPLERRLALAYAPARARAATLALLALDSALAGVVRSTREAMLGQLRLAWWREALARPPGQRAQGEPVLAALAAAWGEEGQTLQGLVDGWEVLLGDAPLASDQLAAFVSARGQACAALAGKLGQNGSAEQARLAGEEWALAELAPRLSDPAERASVHELIRATPWKPLTLPRALRPIQILHRLALRANGEVPLLAQRRDMLVAFRLGLLGI